MVALLLIGLSGCATYERYRPTFWPFPERKLTTYHTPSMRVDAVNEFARRSTGVDSPEQRQITDQLARQIQVEPDPLVRQAIMSIDCRIPDADGASKFWKPGWRMKMRRCELLVAGRLAGGREARRVPSLAGALRRIRTSTFGWLRPRRLGKSSRPRPMKALAVALDDRDPALQYAGVQSLKAITGHDLRSRRASMAASGGGRESADWLRLRWRNV